MEERDSRTAELDRNKIQVKKLINDLMNKKMSNSSPPDTFNVCIYELKIGSKYILNWYICMGFKGAVISMMKHE